jgi:chromosome segregation ATPase
MSITVPSNFMTTLKVFETYVLSEKKAYEKKIDDFHAKMRVLEEQLSRELATNSEERKQAKAQFKAERRQLQARITDLETELKVAQDRIRRLDELRRDADAKNPDSDRSRADQLATKSRAEELERQLGALREEYSKASLMEDEHRGKMEQYVRELMADSQRYQGECHTLTERLDRLTRELETQKQRGRDLDRQNDHSTQVQEILKQKLANKEQETATLQQTLERVSREKKAAAENGALLQRQKDQLQGELERRQAEISRLKDCSRQCWRGNVSILGLCSSH